MITIEMPAIDVSITERKQSFSEGEPAIKSIYGFIDFHEIPRDKGGIFMFYNVNDELLFVGKARKLRQRIKKHFEDQVSPVKNHRDEIYRIDVSVVDHPMERDIYETFIINEFQSKYNIEKVFYK
ncbi:nucleotide excision repair endonuclease [Jeotgalibacillus sp. ET6]|uniref:nucleotide excision repair endonuclease n=1 Tax=Jeotgalibacillus sp. ET6 TaxID=3037260 RepID=UPI0024187DB5|nr:nucleotide excision repair endonuclease [Jeotgalibacillus sp. ET6]MDG5473032.1 nucleotide excision repair endonuclease [Jeotgalibacillus sp. ET6]